MHENQIYDKDGLFHNIVKKSKIFAGRYTVLPHGAVDLNTNNILSGLDIPADKYPIVACLPPGSSLDTSPAGWEHFYFQLLFLCTSGYTGDNQIKSPDSNTNASLHAESLDWNDMKNAALAFYNALYLIKPTMLGGKFKLFQGSPIRIRRVTAMQNDKLSGIMFSFEAMLAVDCDYTDIEGDVSLEFTEHAEHYH